MDRSSADAFVYAKASGMLAKSFVGSRASKIFAVSSIQELWVLLFQEEVPALPEVMLAEKLEQKAEATFIQDYILLLRNYSAPSPILVDLLRYYDYENLKDIIASLCKGQNSSDSPYLADIKEFSMLNYSGWPNLHTITQGSPLSWCNEVPSFEQQQEYDFKLDLQYLRSEWEGINKLPSALKNTVSNLYKNEMILNNMIWAIRLRLYYGMSKEQVIPLLFTIQDCKSETNIKQDPLAGPVFQILDWDLNSYETWAKWKYSYLLNPATENTLWQIDPRWIQQSAKVYFNKKALKLFHRQPFTPAVLLTWFKIKQYELDCIRTATEGLRLNIPMKQAQAFAGATEE